MQVGQLSARSPLSEAEKEAIVRAEYLPAAHRIGLDEHERTLGGRAGHATS